MRKTKYDTVMKSSEKSILWSEPWHKAFGDLSDSGLWFIWGNSGNGKSHFCIQLAKELAKSKAGRVMYVSLEEGYRKSFKNTLAKVGITDVKKWISFFNEKTTLARVRQELVRTKSEKIVMIDSIQCCVKKYDEVKSLLKDFPDKLFIFISQTEGKQPRGKAACDTKFYAAQKFWVQGYRAISHGRSNPGGHYTIWPEAAAKYWGDK